MKSNLSVVPNTRSLLLLLRLPSDFQHLHVSHVIDTLTSLRDLTFSRVAMWRPIGSLVYQGNASPLTLYDSEASAHRCYASPLI